MRPDHLLLVLALLATSAAQADDRGLTLTGSAETRYESNLFRLPGGPLPPQLSRDDLLFVPQVQAKAVLPLSLQKLTLDASAGYRFYTQNTQLNAVVAGAGAQLDWQIGSRCDGALSGRYARTPSAFEDSRLTIRSFQNAYDAGLSARCTVFADWSLKAEGNWQARENDRNELALSNIEQLGATLRLSWDGSETLKPYLVARYRHRDQPNIRRVDVVAFGAKADIWEGGGGFTYALTPFIDLEAELLATHVSDDFTNTSDTQASWLAALRWTVTPKISTLLRTSRRNESNADLGAIAYRATGVEAEASWEATPLLRTTLNYTQLWRNIDRLVATLSGVPTLRAQNDNSRAIELAAQQALGERFSLRASLARQWRSGSLPDLDYGNNRVSVRLTYQWP